MDTLQHKLRNMKFGSCDSLSYQSFDKKILTELKNAGGKMDDLEVISHLLPSIIQPKYQRVVTPYDIFSN